MTKSWFNIAYVVMKIKIDFLLLIKHVTSNQLNQTILFPLSSQTNRNSTFFTSPFFLIEGLKGYLPFYLNLKEKKKRRKRERKRKDIVMKTSSSWKSACKFHVRLNKTFSWPEKP